MDDPSITIKEYIRLEEEKTRRHGKVYNWETATYGKIWDNEDVHDLGSFETEFPAIVFNDTLTSEALLCKPMVRYAVSRMSDMPYPYQLKKILEYFILGSYAKSSNTPIKAQSENNSQVSRVERKTTCTNCKEAGHNKSSCKKEPVPKPPKVNRPAVPKPHEYGTYAFARGRRRGSRGGRGSFGSRGEGTATMGESSATMGATRRSQRGMGRGQKDRGRGQKIRGRDQRGRGRGQMLRDKEEMTDDEIRKNLEHEYMEEMLLHEEQKFDAYQAQQDKFNQEALRYTLEEEDRFKKEDKEILKEKLAEEEWKRKMDYFHPSNWTQKEESFEVEPYNKNLNLLGDFEAEDNYKSNANLEIPSEEPIAAVTSSADKGKQLAEPSEQPELQPQAIKRGSKRKALASSEEAPGKKRIIFHKNRGRSERIFNQKMKKSGFRPDGEGSTPDKAFSLI
ncbi:hypothetical protein Tco_0978065 [Tanacetum coccineum]|uniref:CCHC-type domain-containing protein n=1 Tax=Tanacetum coccineum TaxID=301880 RepID=A0ABQ5EMD0_9ASTR